MSISLLGAIVLILAFAATVKTHVPIYLENQRKAADRAVVARLVRRSTLTQEARERRSNSCP